MSMQTTGDKVLAAIEAKGLKHWRPDRNGTGNRYRGSDPTRTDSDGDNFSLMIEPDGEHGAWHSHKTGQGGSLYDLAEQLGVDLPEMAEAERSGRAYLDLQEYAIARGVKEAVFKKAGWTDQTPDGEPLKHMGRLVIRYPYSGNGQTHYRVRFLDGEKPKYMPMKAGQPSAVWYGLERAIRTAINSPHKALFIVNGESSTVVAQSYGIAACATTTGEKANGLAPELLKELQGRCAAAGADLKLYVIPDADKAGETYAEAVAAQTGATILLHGMQAQNADICDWLRLHAEDGDWDATAALLALPKAAQPPATARSNGKAAPPAAGLVNFADLMDARLAHLDEIEAGTVEPIQGMRSGITDLDSALAGFRPGQVTVILGDTGSGKSTLAAGLVAEFMKQAPVYVETTELTPVQYADKLACAIALVPISRLMRGRLMADEIAKLRSAYHAIGQRVVLAPRRRSTPEEFVEHIARAQQDFGIKSVVLDSINKLRIYSKGGSSFHDMTMASDTIMEVGRNLNLPVVVTSQVGRKLVERDNKRPGLNDAYMSGGIEQDASNVLGMYYPWSYVLRGELDEADCDLAEGHAQINCLKLRFNPYHPPVDATFIGGSRFTNHSGAIPPSI